MATSLGSCASGCEEEQEDSITPHPQPSPRSSSELSLPALWKPCFCVQKAAPWVLHPEDLEPSLLRRGLSWAALSLTALSPVAGPGLIESNWPKEYPDCGGQRQSPINLQTKKVKFNRSLKPLILKGYGDDNLEFSMTNNGHTGQGAPVGLAVCVDSRQ